MAFPRWSVFPPAHFRACDVAAAPQQVLLKMIDRFDGSQSCLYADINDRLPRFALEALDNLEPPVRASIAAQRAAREAQHKWLQEHMT
eukprot:9861925-Lingulodinium_polyedra.AAC.1